MCGRVVQARPAAALAEMFGAELGFEPPSAPGPRYNVVPSQPLLAVVAHAGRRYLVQHRWGLVPAWAKDPARFSARTNNARAETVAEKPSFRDSFRRKRSILPVDAFYEWSRRDGSHRPYAIVRRDGRPLAMAGLWASWRADEPEGLARLLTCAVVTTEANAVVGQLHDRMPVMLPEEAWDLWLDPTVQEPERLLRLLRPDEDDVLRIYPVDPAVNSARNDGPQLLSPVVPAFP